VLTKQLTDAELTRLAEVTLIVEAVEQQFLADVFGRRSKFRNGMAFHNLDHACDVATEAEANVLLLIAAGRLPAWARFAARIAGLFHDHVQDAEPGRNEARSIEAAEAAMRRCEELFPEFRALVREGITATENDIDEDAGLIVQNVGPIDEAATPEQLFRAAVADADVSSLGRPGNEQPLCLYVERHWDELAAGEWSTLRSVAPNPAHAGAWLQKQARLHGAHQFLLPYSRRRYMHQAINAAELNRLGEQLAAAVLTWRQAVDLTTPPGRRA
jgi:hypothetical protein